jgi:hypothetical protein
MTRFTPGQKVRVYNPVGFAKPSFAGKVGVVVGQDASSGTYDVRFHDGVMSFDEDELRPVVPPLRVYLAGTGHDPEIENQQIPSFIKAVGHELVSTWHEPGHWVPGTMERSDAEWDAIAEKNFEDLARAEAVLVKIPPVSHHLRGAHVECGVALAKGLKVVVWGQPGDLDTMVPRSRCVFAPNWAEVNVYLNYWAKSEARSIPSGGLPGHSAPCISEIRDHDGSWFWSDTREPTRGGLVTLTIAKDGRIWAVGATARTYWEETLFLEHYAPCRWWRVLPGGVLR